MTSNRPPELAVSDARSLPAVRGPRASGNSTAHPRRSLRRRLPTGLGLALPAIVFVFAFMVFPMASLVYLSVHEYSPLRSTDTIFVGLDNFAWLLESDLVRSSLWVTLVFTFGSVALELVVGLLVATLLARLVIGSRTWAGRWLGRLFSSVFIIPFAAPAIAAAVAWKMLLDPVFGPVNAALGTQTAWFAEFPLASVIVVDAWKMMPFVLFLLFAAIMSVEPEQYEAARIDGASGWQEFRFLTLPSILPVIAVTAAFRAVDAFTKIFDTVFVTTGGGPGNDTQVFPLLIWKTAFEQLNYGPAAALAMVAVLASAVLGAGLLALRGRTTP
jgi:multiple sugar transport system permease protein